MDPYNTHGAYVPMPAARGFAPPVVNDGHIDRLAVSEKWKKRFRAIEKAGGANLPKFKSLSVAERRSINFNWIAFVLGPFYFLAKGLWRQTIVYVVLAIALALVFEILGLGKFGRAIGYGFAAVYAIRANVSYYRRMVVGEAPWF